MVVSILEERIVNEALKEFRKESMSIDDAEETKSKFFLLQSNQLILNYVGDLFS
jgi:hypothetical protein